MKETARYTRSFALTVLDLLRFGTIKSVAEYLHIGWDTVKNIHKAKLTTVYRNIKAVSMDMSGSFISSFKEFFRNVPIIFDRYIMAQINRGIDSLRREQFNLLDTAGQNILKGSRFLLLRNFHSLTERNKCRLENLLEVKTAPCLLCTA